jgi:hypothetical protein
MIGGFGGGNSVVLTHYPCLVLTLLMSSAMVL